MRKIMANRPDIIIKNKKRENLRTDRHRIVTQKEAEKKINTRVYL
jgi:hypothetical protein